MPMIDKSEQGTLLERISIAVAKGIGTTRGFLVGLLIVTGGFLYGFGSNFDLKWHLAMHTVLALITFILLFITSRVEQKEMTAVQLKLNELIAALEGASNKLINAEDAPETQLKEARGAFEKVSEDKPSTESTSLERKEESKDMDSAA